MRKRSLGNSGLEVAPLAFGGNVFGWTVDERTSFRLLDAFAAAGFNLIDTADAYSRFAPGNRGGESETIIGKWLKQGGRRDKVIIATKVGLEMGPHRKGLSKAYILRAAEDSLRRLQTEYIDLYQSHRDDPDTSLDETLQAYAQLPWLFSRSKFRPHRNFVARAIEHHIGDVNRGATESGGAASRQQTVYAAMRVSGCGSQCLVANTRLPAIGLSIFKG